MVLVPEYQERFERHFRNEAPGWMKEWLESPDEKMRMAIMYKHIMEKMYACGIQDATLGKFSEKEK